MLIAEIGFGIYWFTTLRWFESTDDAYAQAEAVVIAPKVAGYVTQLSVTDNQLVTAGEVLLRIDPRDYQCAQEAMLTAGLKGYADYVRRVRFRLVPGI